MAERISVLIVDSNAEQCCKLGPFGLARSSTLLLFSFLFVQFLFIFVFSCTVNILAPSNKTPFLDFASTFCTARHFPFPLQLVGLLTYGVRSGIFLPVSDEPA